MKRLLLIFLTLLMLCGCSSPEEPAAPITEPTAIPTEAPTDPVGFYDPTHELESLTGGLKVYPLEQNEILSVVPMGNDLLVFSLKNSDTYMTILRGDQLYEVVSTPLPSHVSPFSPSFHVSEKGIAYYDEAEGDLIYLDTQLREVSRLSLPEDLHGEPILSADRKRLYYLTGDSLREMDLELGIDRLIRQMSHEGQRIKALHLDDSILECSVYDENYNIRRIFLQVATGEQIAEASGELELATGYGYFLAQQMDGLYPEKLIGSGDGEILMLHMPDYTAEAYPVLAQAAVVTVTAEDNTYTLDYYRLEDGTHPYSLTLPADYSPASPIAHPSGDALWLLVHNAEQNLLCRWDLSESSVEDDTVYIGLRWTDENPDAFGLEKCRELAAQLSEKHGVEILTWTDATAAQPWDYRLVPEHQPELVLHYLKELDQALSRYPAGMLSQAVSEMGDGKLRIGLVRSITGLSGASFLSSAAGLQFWQEENGNPYVILQAADAMASNLHHELFHIIESRIFSLSKALDDWNKLNPKDFEYDNSYLYYTGRDESPLISGETRAFIDYYSMTFPKEDRARIMEYAMMENQENCFSSDTMQQKLRALCLGIRQAYGLDVADLPWEQYLKDPIA